MYRSVTLFSASPASNIGGPFPGFRTLRRRVVTQIRAFVTFEAKADDRWLLNFFHGQLACGRRSLILNMVDDVACKPEEMPWASRDHIIS